MRPRAVGAATRNWHSSRFMNDGQTSGNCLLDERVVAVAADLSCGRNIWNSISMCTRVVLEPGCEPVK